MRRAHVAVLAEQGPQLLLQGLDVINPWGFRLSVCIGLQTVHVRLVGQRGRLGLAVDQSLLHCRQVNDWLWQDTR